VPTPLLPALGDPPRTRTVTVAGRSLDYHALRRAAGSTARRLEGMERVAVWAAPSIETAVGVLAGLAAGVAVVPVNPRIGERELAHVVADSAPSAVLSAPGELLPAGLAEVSRIDIGTDAPDGVLPEEPGADQPAFVLYTSGTTGPPKGAVIPRSAIAANLDALAAVWEWTDADVLVHGLPLFHVHGLVLGLLGPIRLGGGLRHVGRFTPESVAAALADGGTMLFGVPTMYHRLADACGADGEVRTALAGARLLVSGSAALPAREHTRIERATGQRVVERYGLTETLINTSIPASGERGPGTVGLPLPGVDLRLLDDAGDEIETSDDATIGEVAVRGPNLFAGYLNRPEATAAAMRDGWFLTGDLATRGPGGYLRIVGRRATDLIKTGGFKVGAGEIEGALLEHPAVAEAAVKGEPDDDLGERIVAWVVVRDGPPPSAGDLADHVASLLAPHKRPRSVRFLDALPRNELGKVRKGELE
jgi:malonyl-CoA/methylmalonyl-CoA synthetase